jgi:hypothetical protein
MGVNVRFTRHPGKRFSLIIFLAKNEGEMEFNQAIVIFPWWLFVAVGFRFL